MLMDRLAPPPPTERQLALPLAPVSEPPSLTGLGPAVLPRKVWRSLAVTAQVQVRLTALRVLMEVLDDADRP
jgi:hypothetical protein